MMHEPSRQLMRTEWPQLQPSSLGVRREKCQPTMLGNRCVEKTSAPDSSKMPGEIVGIISRSADAPAAGIITEQEAIGDLCMLHKDGLQVVWPRSHRQREREHRPQVTTDKTNSSKTDCAVSSSLQEALEDLRDLQKDGLSVVWPRGLG